MNAFETVVAMLLRNKGYWVMQNYKVELVKEEKRAIERPSSPRWEIDIVAYKGATNELIAIECKSFLDSRGVVFKQGAFHRTNTYKLFNNSTLRKVVLKSLVKQLVKKKFCPTQPTVRLGLATGKIANTTDRNEMKAYFKAQKWELFDDKWIKDELHDLKKSKYEDDITFVVAKLAFRDK